ncbi:MAG: DEAD/DEAH box helicase [Nanoarchaeota archaeon]|jgi:ATP-dependent RNA helicase DeaD|nr:DEAD/DEAH box helicase [Nanoarchaeota archaeon]
MVKTFKQLGLSEGFIAVLEKLKIEIPTEIQEKAIPFVLKGNDVVASAATGSGKTLAYVSGILENMEPTGNSRVLVLVPTRELAEQVASEFRKFATKKFRVFSIYGGIKIDEHIKKIPGADIVVATPGRLLDLMNRQAFNLKKIEVLILDEFDRMLDMGFSHDVDSIVQKCPKKRQTMLFSATLTDDIEDLVELYTNDAEEINVKSHVDHSKLEQVYYDALQREKFSLFHHLIKKERAGKIMVFCSTRINTEFIAKSLEDLGIETKVIHGGLDQKQRTRTLKSFHNEGGILVCTDVAARGLDIKDITHVYNYDLPSKPEDYIHRIGRTARAGKEGKAITILTPRDHDMFERITELPNIKMQEMDLPVFERIASAGSPRLQKKQENEKTHTKKRGIQWASLDDPDLSNRFRKHTVERNYEEKREPSIKPKKKTRRAGVKVKASGRGKTDSKKKIVTHIAAKGSKVKRGRAGNRTGKVKKKRKGKGQANNKSKK